MKGATLQGYVTLSNAALKTKYVSRDRAHEAFLDVGGLRVEEIPAILIGKLAVQREFQNQKIGKWMVEMVIGFALRQSRSTGIRLLIVDSKPGDAERFYRRNKFKKAIRDRRSPTYFFDLDAVRRG